MHIGIDIGGSFIKIIATKSIDKVSFDKIKVIITSQNFEEGISGIFKVIDNLSSDQESIGISIAGRISDDGKEFIKSNNLAAWTNKGIVKRFNNKFNCPVFLENDAVSQGLAEKYYGSNMKESFIYIVWGTGIGGVVVNNEGKKKAISKLSREYLQCGEDLFGGGNLEGRFNKPVSQISKDEWIIIINKFMCLLEDISKKLNIKKFIISGGVVNKQREIIESKIISANDIEISISELTENIGIYGALALIKDKI